MYGYVRPVKGELKVAEYEKFRRVYCGLCRELKRRGGFWARFVVNYDFTFLAMLLSDDSSVCAEKGSCPVRLGRKLPCITTGSAMSLAADKSIILAWEKLNDGIADGGLLKSFKCRIAKLFLTSAYHNAKTACPAFAEFVLHRLYDLRKLEKSQCPSVDAAADPFAQILRFVPETSDSRQRVLAPFLYHLGRIIYILDAIDDLQTDLKSANYNPLIYRFSLQDNCLSDGQKDELRQTLCRSQRQMASAFELLDRTQWHPILENIIYLGIPQAIESVLNGTWNTKDRSFHERSL